MFYSSRALVAFGYLIKSKSVRSANDAREIIVAIKRAAAAVAQLPVSDGRVKTRGLLEEMGHTAEALLEELTKAELLTN